MRAISGLIVAGAMLAGLLAPSLASADAQMTEADGIEFPVVDGATHDMVAVNGLQMHVAQAGDPDAPLVLLLHGFPELWISWRHQLPALADAGYFAVAPDMRGFGHTDQPEARDAYDALDLCGDITGLMDHFGRERAIVVGHDWGSAAAFYCAQIAPERFEALVTVSVPYGQARPGLSPIEAMRQSNGENFFYMLYFQEDAAEEELNGRTAELFGKFFARRDIPRDAPVISSPLASAGGYLDRIGAPVEPGTWMPPDIVDYYIATYEESGFLGGLNYYRNLDSSWSILLEHQNQMPRPALFIAGENEFLIAGRTPEQILAGLQQVTPDARVEILPEAGHWIQEQIPQAFNATLIDFLDSLPR